MPKRRRANPRTWLVIVWFAFFSANMAVLLYLYFDNWIEVDNFKASMSRLNALYAPFCGAILAFYLLQSNKNHEERKRTGIAFRLAFLCSLAWNLVICAFALRVLMAWGTIEQSLADMEFFGSVASWMVGPAIGFYFARPSELQTSRP